MITMHKDDKELIEKMGLPKSTMCYGCLDTFAYNEVKMRKDEERSGQYYCDSCYEAECSLKDKVNRECATCKKEISINQTKELRRDYLYTDYVCEDCYDKGMMFKFVIGCVKFALVSAILLGIIWALMQPKPPVPPFVTDSDRLDTIIELQRRLLNDQTK